jgi:hypothetical protein
MPINSTINFVPDEVPQAAVTSGAPIAFTPDDQVTKDYQEQQLQEQYGSPTQQLQAGAQGLLRGALSRPVADLVENAVGVPQEAKEGLEKANPVSSMAGEALGLGAGPFGKVLGVAGKGVAGALGAEGALGVAAKLGTESALLGAADETSKYINGSPDSIQSAAMHVGLSGLIGLAAGAGLGTISSAWTEGAGPGLDQGIKEFVDTTKAISNDTLPTVENVSAELTNEYRAAEAASRDLNGDAGLKAQDIQKLVPEEATPQIAAQGQKIAEVTDSLLSKVAEEPQIHSDINVGAVAEYQKRLNLAAANPSITPAQSFQALDQFKRGIGTLVDWNGPSTEGQSALKKLYNTVKEALEDSSVWGEAGEAQAAINKAISEAIPAQKAFRNSFTELASDGSRMVSPTKVTTLMNKLGEPGSAVRLERLAGYLESNTHMYDQLENIHNDFGLDNPYIRPDLTNTRQILKDITPSMKLAMWMHGQAVNLAAEGGSLTAGYAAGGPMGALLSRFAAKPLLKTVMPSIINPLLRTATSGGGLEAALRGVNAIMRGEALANSAAKALFQVGGQKVLDSLDTPKDKIDRLKDRLTELQQDPSQMLGMGGKLAHYMPGHATAMAQAAQTTLDYLNAQKPLPTRAGMLGREQAPSSSQNANYNRTLQIANQPLVVLKHLSRGSLQPKDVQDLNTMYPALAPRIVQKINSSMIDHVAKGNQVPFKMRAGLSLLMGQPVDSSFTQPAIMAAQQTFVPATPPVMPQGKQQVKKGTSKLGKQVETAQTPVEARTKALQKA